MNHFVSMLSLINHSLVYFERLGRSVGTAPRPPIIASAHSIVVTVVASKYLESVLLEIRGLSCWRCCRLTKRKVLG
jgi:hypothetical protein